MRNGALHGRRDIVRSDRRLPARRRNGRSHLKRELLQWSRGGQRHVSPDRRFFAQVYANPQSPSRIRWVRTIALGEHHLGLSHVSFRLGTLSPGSYGIIILRTRTAYPWLLVPTGGPQTTTWLGLSVTQTGQVVAVRPQ